MKRSLASLMIIVASAACTDGEAAPSEVSQNRATEGDGGVAVDSSVAVVVNTDSGATEPRVRVTNTGAPCELRSQDCQGGDPECLEISRSGAIYSGGYCTSDCKQSAECGPNAECPVAEAALAAPNYDFRSTWARKCFKSCTPGSYGQCRSGYKCTSLADAYATPDAPAPMHRTVCLPHASTPAGQSLDGGAAAPRNNLDAG